MGLESSITQRIIPNEHVEYRQAVSLDEVTFKETYVALHAATDEGVLSVIEEANQIPVEQFLTQMQGTEICIVEFDGDKVGYFVGNEHSGFYLGPEIDLEFLKENKPEIFENIQEEGAGMGGAQPQVQPQLAAAPATPGGAMGGGGQAAQGLSTPTPPGSPPETPSGIPPTTPPASQEGSVNTSSETSNMSMDELMAVLKNPQAGKDGGTPTEGDEES